MAGAVAIGEESDISDFEIDDEIKKELNTLMNLEFIDDSSEDEPDEGKRGKESEEVDDRGARGDSLERELEMMFMSQHVKEVPGGAEEGASKDTGLESISENELDGPESGECDTSDGELPDSPNIVVTMPDTPPISHVLGVEDLSGSSDVELVEEYQNRGREYYDTITQKVNIAKPNREVIIEPNEPQKKKERSPSKSKDKIAEKVKKDKKEKSKKKVEVDCMDEEMKRKLKLKKYLARLEVYKEKCRSYMSQIAKKCDIIKRDEKNKIRVEKSKIKNITVGEGNKLRSIVEKVNRDREISPQSSTSSKFDEISHCSHSSKADKTTHTSTSEDQAKRHSTSSEKERKSKHKKTKSKSKELKEHKLLYQKYMQYLQIEREKCFEEGMVLNDKHKKSKRRKSKSKSPEKKKETPVLERKVSRPPILSFAEFCNNRELASPEKEIPNSQVKMKALSEAEVRKERTISIDSVATTATVRSDQLDHGDEDKELFITYSDLVEQDKLSQEKTNLKEDREKIETELEKDPELKSISVFTSVLFKGGADSDGIPFLTQEHPSPKPEEFKPKKSFVQDTGIDEIYDMNDDLSNISQSSLSPSRSPVPKLHNKALLNYLENQKERQDKPNKKSSERKSKSSRSRSKSPRKERSRSKKRKRKHHSSISTVSPSPPPLRPRSPDTMHRKRPSPPAYLKERWKDYPSPPEHRLPRREHRLPRSRRRSRSRTRKVHRSRSSSEERHYRRYRSRSRTRSKSRSRSPPVLAMVQLTVAEKRRKLREDHERALASLRETIRKPLSATPLSITITNHGDNFESITDNYDPVVMNEDSSSNPPSEVSGDKASDCVPALPPLPPEPPPVPPPPTPALPTVEKREDLTVVTTYTSFVPLPNTNIVPPAMGYDVQIPSFSNWMPPVADIQHHMFPPPQMMNTYDQFNTPPPQQPFPFINQPPPPLPYQMTMPPPCHQHYRMPSQAPPSNMNVIQHVHQEIKNIKSNPVVITQIPDSSDIERHNLNIPHPLEATKCKHNPLGQNHQTVQEAIDSVKKCLKNCDALKNKDPRLALADTRKKSPERSESAGGPDERKIKITLNYKPRPISAAEQSCIFDPASEELDGRSPGFGESNVKPKTDNYTEKNSHIEGIVSKLKDNIGTVNSVMKEDSEKNDSHKKMNQSVDSLEKSNPGDEPYDPFNVSDDTIDENANSEESNKVTPVKQNENCQTLVVNDSKPKLSESEVENINDQINKSFAFILSHSIERKRLTPTLSSIIAKKVEQQKKCEPIEKISFISKHCHTLQEKQKNKNRTTAITNTELSSSAVSQPKENMGKKSNTFEESILKNEMQAQCTLYTPARSLPKCDAKKEVGEDTSKGVSFETEKNKAETTEVDISIGTSKSKSESIDTNIGNTNKTIVDLNGQPEKVQDTVCSYEMPSNENISGTNLKKGTSNSAVKNESNKLSEMEDCKPQYSISNKDKPDKNLFDFEKGKGSETPEESCFLTDIQHKGECGKYEYQTTNSNNLSTKGKVLLEDKEISLKTGSNNLTSSSKDEESQLKISDDRRSEFSLGINIDLIEDEDSKQSYEKTFSSELKNNHNLERRGHAPLSIPTKGELKRFPTPERTMPKQTKSDSVHDKEIKESTLTKKMSLKSKESRESLEENKSKDEPMPSSVNVVESILNDFEESNSIGLDFQELGKEDINNTKNIEKGSSSNCIGPDEVTENKRYDLLKNPVEERFENSVSKPNLLMSNNISSKSDVLGQTLHQNEILKSEKTLNLLPGNTKAEDNIHQLDCAKSNHHEQNSGNSDSDMFTTKELLADDFVGEEINKIQDYSVSKESNEDCPNLRGVKDRMFRRSRRKWKSSKSYDPLTNKTSKLIKMDTSETGNDLESESLKDTTFGKEVGNTENKDSACSVVKDQNDGNSPNLLSVSPVVLLKPILYKKQLKPCPLSRKSKSYISQNLPLSFDLSVDGHLIRRGFKTLRVYVQRLTSEPAGGDTEESKPSTGISSPSLSFTSSNIDCYIDLGVDNDAINRNTEILPKNQADSKINNEKPKKRVSFDLNVSEIYDDNKFFTGDEVSANTEESCKVKDDSNDKNISLNISKNTLTNETNNIKEADIIIEQTNDIKEETSPPIKESNNEENSRSLSSFYEGIVNTLIFLRESPLPQLRQKKSVLVSIPKPEDMPEAKILNSPKRTNRAKSKKSDIQNLLEEHLTITQSQVTETDQENPLIDLSKPKEKETSKCDISKKIVCEVSRNNKCDSSEINESDNDDSMILDRELSDLAKGCLDSDSTVGEDGDSVLNFGIVASDDSSMDSDFDFKCKRTFSKFPTRQKNKLSSPHNIKKRFAKKFRSLNEDLESKKIKNSDSEPLYNEENQISDEQNVIDSQATIDRSEETEKQDNSVQLIMSEKTSLNECQHESYKLNEKQVMETTEPNPKTDFKPITSDSHLTKGKITNKKKQKKSRRQKNTFGESLINREPEDQSTTDMDQGNTNENQLTNKTYTKNSYEIETPQKDILYGSSLNCTENYDTLEDEGKEVELNKDCSTSDIKEKDKVNSNIIGDDNEKPCLDSSEKDSGSHVDDINIVTQENVEGSSDGVLQNVSEKKLRKQKTGKKNKSPKEVVSNDMLEVNVSVEKESNAIKMSPIRKTRRGTIFEKKVSDDTAHLEDENNTSKQSNFKETLKMNETANTRRTRRGRNIDDISLCSDENSLKKDFLPTVNPPEINCKDQYNVEKDNVCSDDQSLQNQTDNSVRKESKINLAAKVSPVPRKSKNVLNNVTDTCLCNEKDLESSTDMSDKSTHEERLKSKITEDESPDKDPEGHVKEDAGKTNEELNSKFTESEFETKKSDLEDKKNKVNNKQKKGTEKLEFDSSTSSNIMNTDNIRKTRSSQRKQEMIVDVNKSEKAFAHENSESPVRKTRNQKIVSGLVEKEEPKEEKDDNKVVLVTTCDLNNSDANEVKLLNGNEDKLDTKKPQVVERTLSTESFDEPLIVVKNKLLASKIKVQEENTTNDEFEDSKSSTSNIFKDENIQSKLKSTVSDSSASTGQGSQNENSKLNDGKNMQNTRNSGDESYSENCGSNSFSNAGHNSRSYSSINGVSSSGTSSDLPISNSYNTIIDRNKGSPINSQNIYSLGLQQKCLMNPKLKEAIRKKRDKAEVDAEIKRRLAEIDELEKLARSQHANVLEKIGARTRSRKLTSNDTANLEEEEDVVSISSDDSQGTSVGTNEAIITGSKIEEISKSEGVNEEPTTTQVDGIKTPHVLPHNESTGNPVLASEDENGPKETVLVLPSDTVRRTRSKKVTENEIESISKAETDIPENSVNDLSKFCSQKSPVVNKNKTDSFIAKSPNNNLPEIEVFNTVTSEIQKISLLPVGQRTVPKENKVGSLSTDEQLTNRNHSDIVSVYQFRESDELDPDEKIDPKQRYYRTSKRRTESGKQENNTDLLPTTMEKPFQLPEKRTRNNSGVLKTPFRKYNKSSREPSPSSQTGRETTEQSIEIQSNTNLSTNTVPEPDSSTSVVTDSSCPHPESSNISEGVTKYFDSISTNQKDEQHSVESSVNTSQELDTTESTPTTGFKQPYRKSLVNRRRKRRRSYFGRGLIPCNNLENQVNETFSEKNDQVNAQSEEVVSSSVNTVQDKKKRRRRKTVMDLLMEDSMLSVTRDFPMSPNPYMFSSFYKDIDLSSSNNKTNAANETSVAEKNFKKVSEDHALPPKPDFIAQKLRILEKLKSISRKNRKTRQCRTLVCYNEDSLPESLVESPVGESVVSNGDNGILIPEVISANISMNENDGESSIRSSSTDSPVVSKVHFQSTVEESDANDLSFISKRKVQKPCISKAQLKKGRKERMNKIEKKSNNKDQWETQCEKASVCDSKENKPDDNCSLPLLLDDKLRDEFSSFDESKSNDNKELSEFDKLLESKPNDTKRLKLTYDYKPISPQSPSEDKSDDAPDDYFNSLPSPLRSSDDETSASENSCDSNNISFKVTAETSSVVNNNITSPLKEYLAIRPEKIICSIPKTKIGKMLPYFGDSDEDLDEDDDVPLSVKLSQFTEEDDLQSHFVKENVLSTPSEIKTSSINLSKSPSPKRRCQKPIESFASSIIRKSERSTRSSTAALLVDDSSVTAKINDFDQKKFDSLDRPFSTNADSVTQLRKSSRRHKTSNLSLKDEIDFQIDNTNPSPDTETVCEKINKEIERAPCLDLQIEPLTTKRKGRPPKIKLVDEKQANENKLKQLDHPIQFPLEEELEYENQSNSDTNQNMFLSKRENLSKAETDSTYESPFINESMNSDEGCKSLTFDKNQESHKLKLSDLNSAIQKSISLRRTRANSVKPSVEVEGSLQEANSLQQKESELDIEDDSKIKSLEDLPLIKRAVREFPLKRRGRKVKTSLGTSDQYLPLNNSSDDVDESNKIGDSVLCASNKEESHSSISTTFNESPPPLIRTRARRAKLMTSDNNDLDPPNLETSIPQQEHLSQGMNNEKEDLECSVNVDSNLDSTGTLINEDCITLPPRKRGRKPKKILESEICNKNNVSESTVHNVSCKTQDKIQQCESDNSREKLIEEISLDQENNHSKPQSTPVEVQILTRRRGRRVRRKTIRKKAGQQCNLPNKEVDSDYDSEVEINMPIIKYNDNVTAGNLNNNTFSSSTMSKDHFPSTEHSVDCEENISDLREDVVDFTNAHNEKTHVAVVEEAGKRKRKIKENVEEIKTINNTLDCEENGSEESEDIGVKKKRTQDLDYSEEKKTTKSNETSTTVNSFRERPASTSQNCANQPFLWNKISAFLNKTTRSVGTQVKVKNMTLKGFETSEPQVSLQSELTLPQVIKTLFEELRFIDSSFSNS